MGIVTMQDRKSIEYITRENKILNAAVAILGTDVLADAGALRALLTKPQFIGYSQHNNDESSSQVICIGLTQSSTNYDFVRGLLMNKNNIATVKGLIVLGDDEKVEKASLECEVLDLFKQRPNKLIFPDGISDMELPSSYAISGYRGMSSSLTTTDFERFDLRRFIPEKYADIIEKLENMYDNIMLNRNGA